VKEQFVIVTSGICTMPHVCKQVKLSLLHRSSWRRGCHIDQSQTSMARRTIKALL